MLTSYAKVLQPLVEGILKNHHGKDAAVSIKDMLLILEASGYKSSPEDVREALYRARIDGSVGSVLSSKEGYYVSTDAQEIREYCANIDKQVRKLKDLRVSLEECISGGYLL